MSDDLYMGPTVLAPGAPPTGDQLARRLLIPLTVVLVLLVLVFQVFFSTSAVKGVSMEPTLIDGDRLLVTRGYDTPDRGDVVVYDIINEEGETEGLIKRVIAIPGDTIEVRQGIALVNGAVENLDSRNTSEYDRTYDGPLVVPEGQVYVLGDNRPVAFDSRDTGPVPLEKVRGRARYLFAPITRIGTVR